MRGHAIMQFEQPQEMKFGDQRHSRHPVEVDGVGEMSIDIRFHLHDLPAQRGPWIKVIPYTSYLLFVKGHRFFTFSVLPPATLLRWQFCRLPQDRPGSGQTTTAAG